MTPIDFVRILAGPSKCTKFNGYNEGVWNTYEKEEKMVSNKTKESNYNSRKTWQWTQRMNNRKC